MSDINNLIGDIGIENVIPPSLLGQLDQEAQNISGESGGSGGGGQSGGNCPDVEVPDEPQLTPGSKQFLEKMTRTTRILRQPWDRSTYESAEDLSERTLNKGINLLLPGIRDQLLPEPVDTVQSIIGATSFSFDLVDKAGLLLLVTQFRNVVNEIDNPTPVLSEQYFSEIGRPFGEPPQTENQYRLSQEANPEDRPYFVLADELQATLFARFDDKVSWQRLEKVANTVHLVLSQQFIPEITEKNLISVSDVEPFEGCSDFGDERKYGYEDARTIGLLNNLELLNQVAQVVKTAAANQQSPNENEERTVQFSDGLEDGTNDGWELIRTNKFLTEDDVSFSPSQEEAFEGEWAHRIDRANPIGSGWIARTLSEEINATSAKFAWYGIPGIGRLKEGVKLTDSNGRHLLKLRFSYNHPAAEAGNGIYLIGQSGTNERINDFEPETWYEIEIENINYQDATYDININGNTIESGLSFRDNSFTGIQRFVFNTNQRGTVLYQDNLSLRL